jgi:tetratricopeptide (TPR) repeat protein
MGFWASLFGTDPDSRIRKARKFLDRHDFSEARMELLELDHPEAGELLQTALEGLIRLNLEEAAARSSAGDSEGAAEHLELAQSYGAGPEQLRTIRRSMREDREELRREAQVQVEIIEAPEGDDPLWSLTPDDPRLRFALMLESWPQDLRGRLASLGLEFAYAAMLLEDGEAKKAVEKLTPFVHREVAARWLRAKAQLALGELAAAASDLATMGDAIGHRTIGKQHSAVLLAHTLGQLGRLEDALQLVESEREGLDEHDPVQLPLSGSRAAFLEALGRLDEAEVAVEAVVLRAPRDLGLYRMLARIRVGLGKRMAAMQALEGGLDTCCSSPGKCGNQPFDVAAGRLLARLYLEDRIEHKRVEELLRELGKNVQQSGWEDRYLATLFARNSQDPNVGRMARDLGSELGAGDPRQGWLTEQFG